MSVFGDIATWIINGIILLGGLSVAVAGLLYVNQDKMLYIPCPSGFPKEPHENPPGFISPGEWTKSGRRSRKGLNDPNSIPFEEKFIRTEDGIMIHTWLLLHDDSGSRPTLVRSIT